MSAAIGLQDSSVPSESWDDDFDFQSQSGSPKRTRNAQETPATMRMSTATEDWDIDNLTSTTSVTNHEPPRPSPHVLADKINITAANLANWSEKDPTTPQKASFSIEPTTENWDDDFLDKTDSPARRSSRSNNTPSRHSIGGKLRAGVPVRHHKPLREGEEEEHESWDDEFDFNSSPAKPTKSSTPGKSRRTPVRHSDHRSSLSPGNHHDSSDDDDEADIGGIGAEDDRTVTARSRRAPQSHTPPPPVPTIPFTLTPVTVSASTSTNTHLTTPFPRSPTASVFSVPGSSIAETTSLRSTAPLRPSLSRNAASASNALKYFPPSPPLHRERRRLRKKSRPQPQGVMELVDMSHHHHHHYPLSDTDADHQRLDELDERRTPSPPPTPDPISASVPPTPSQSTSTGGALLSRIGSVKRWNVRRKKGSSTPSDAPAKEEKGKDTTNHSDGVPVPRPRTSLSSLLPSNQQQQSTTNALPPPSSSWFFRPTSPVNSRGRNAHGKNQTSTSIPRTSYTGSRSGSMTDLSMRGSIYASSSNYEDDDTNNFSTQKSPNKLLKRKSLGFVQLRKGLMPSTSIPTTSGGSAAEKGGFGGDLSLSLSDLHQYKSGPGSKRPMSMQPQPRLPSGMHPATQRHASYGTTRPKKVAEVNTDDLHNHESESTRDRKQSSTSRSGGVRPKSKAAVKEKESKENVRNVEREKEKERDEGSRSFMGSMRRLSLVNRHRRNKSGASLMETMSRISAEAPTTPPPPPLPSTSEPPSLPPLPLMSDFHVPRPCTPHTPVSSSVPSLLPPIELQPPSPPRPDDGPRIALSPNTDSLLSPVSTTSSSVAPATTPTSASAGTSTSTLSSPPSSSASSSPRSTKQAPKTPGPATVRSSPPKRFSPKTPRTPKTTTSPHGTASLGRSTISPKHGILGISPAEAFPRRNSLSDLKSDLKIPARISQAQQGLKRDLGMVRDFAVYIEQLKKQQEMYHDLVQRMQHKLDAQAHLAQQQTSSTQQQQRAVSPSFFNLTKPKTRARSNTNPGNGSGSRYKELAAAFYTINSKYRISWECAELLVDLADGTSAALGSGPGNVGEGVPSSSVSAPVGLGASGEKKKGRERAITLAGDKSRPSTPTAIVPSNSMPASSTSASAASPPSWRASTGRHDLSHRQLVLLREMLNNAEAVLSADGSTPTAGNGVPSSVPEEVITASMDDLRVPVNREWRWGDPMSSTITLPSSAVEDTDQGAELAEKKKNRRKSKLVGMTGIRDMLRALKRNVSDSSSTAARDHLSPPLPMIHNHAMLSTASLSTDTSFERSSAGHGHNANLPQPPTTNSEQQQGRKPRSSSGPEVVSKAGKERGRGREQRDPSPSPYGGHLTTKPSPRRPSLASIFRIGRKHAPPSASTTDLSLHGSDNYHTDVSSRPGTSTGVTNSSHQQQRVNTGSPLEEDWDRMDSASDMDVAAMALGVPTGSVKEGGGTLKLRKGKSPYLHYQAPSSSSQLARPTTPRRSASGSQLSLWAESPSKQKARIQMQIQQQVTPRAPRLSNVDENVESTKVRGRGEQGQERERRRSSSGKFGSVRSMPPQPVFSGPKLAMTPENIKPLLENAKEVHARLGDCIMEIRRLLDGDGGLGGDRSVSGSSCASGQSLVSS